MHTIPFAVHVASQVVDVLAAKTHSVGKLGGTGGGGGALGGVGGYGGDGGGGADGPGGGGGGGDGEINARSWSWAAQRILECIVAVEYSCWQNSLGYLEVDTLYCGSPV